MERGTSKVDRRRARQRLSGTACFARETARTLYAGPLQTLLAARQDIEGCYPERVFGPRGSLALVERSLDDMLAPEWREMLFGGGPVVGALRDVEALVMSSLSMLDDARAAIRAARASTEAEDQSALIGTAATTVRTAAERMHPSAHEHGGLQPAIRALLPRDAGSAPRLSVDGDGAMSPLTQTLIVVIVRRNLAQGGDLRAVDVSVVGRYASTTVTRAPGFRWPPEALADLRSLVQLVDGAIAVADERAQHATSFHTPVA